MRIKFRLKDSVVCNKFRVKKLTVEFPSNCLPFGWIVEQLLEVHCRHTKLRWIVQKPLSLDRSLHDPKGFPGK